VSVDIDIDDDVILQLALEAHKRDITLNKMVEIILQEVIDRHKVNGTLD
jgi:predicted HicB family RNase H-like nuclease